MQGNYPTRKVQVLQRTAHAGLWGIVILWLLAALAGTNRIAAAAADAALYAPGEVIVRFKRPVGAGVKAADAAGAVGNAAGSPAMDPVMESAQKAGAPSCLLGFHRRFGIRSAHALCAPAPKSARIKLNGTQVAGGAAQASAAGAAQSPLANAASPGAVASSELWVLRFDGGADHVEKAVRSLKAMDNVLYAEPNYVGGLAHVPSDPLYPQTQADLSLIGIEAAWDVQPGSDASVTVAVIDSGVDPTHPDLTNCLDLANSWNFVDGNAEIYDDIGHGTRVTGIIAAEADNGQGIAGVGYGCRVMSLDVTSSAGAITAANAAAAINWAVARGAKIINMSLRFLAKSQALEDACKAAREAGCMIVAAAGNEGKGDTLVYPAAFDTVLGVGAVMDDGVTRAPWSNYNGSGASMVKLVAPGSTVFSCVPGAQYNGTYGSGTSFAAPIVAGVGALLASKYPDQTGTAIAQHIKKTAESLGDWAGSGRCNARAALETTPVPNFTVKSVRVDDAIAYSGANNADGVLQPGETANIYATLSNDGSDAVAVQATLSTSNTDIALIDALGVWGAIPTLEDKENTLNGFDGATLAVNAAAQDIDLNLTISANGGAYIQIADIVLSTEREVIPLPYITTNTTWTRNNTYKLIRNTIVNPGVKLTIEPGTAIHFETTGCLTVQGSISALGTSNQKICFTNTSGGMWKKYGYDPGITLTNYSTYAVRSLAVGDIFNNGLNDIFYLYDHYGSAGYLKWNNKGYSQGYFTSGNPPDQQDCNSCLIADVNNDGYYDLFGAGNAAGILYWPWIGTVGSYINLVPYAQGKNYGSVVIGDIDNDGDNDFTTRYGNDPTGYFRIYRYSGGGWPGTGLTYSDDPSSPRIADVDNDGKNELLVIAPSNCIAVSKWNGSAMSAPTYINAGGPIHNYGIIDYNQDGQNEVLAYVKTLSALKVFQYSGSGYVQITTVAISTTGYMSFADANNDRIKDCVTVEGNLVSILPGLSAGGFGPKIQMGYLSGTPSIWNFGDVNNDGLNDFVAVIGNNIEYYGYNSNIQTPHQGIVIANTASASTFSHCIIQYGPVVDNSSMISWQDCSFENNYPYDIDAQSHWAFSSTVGANPIYRCRVSGNREGGGMAAGTKALYDCVAEYNMGSGLAGGSITNCSVINNFTYGIWASGIVTSCTATRNGDWGIKTTGNIVNSLAYDNTNGIDAASATNCISRINQQIGIKASGSVIGCKVESNGAAGFSGGASFTDCVVFGNGTGLTLTTTATRCYISANVGDGADGGGLVNCAIIGNQGMGADMPTAVSGCYIIANASHGVLNVSNTGGMHGSYIYRNGAGAGYDYRDTRLSGQLLSVNVQGNYWGPITTPLMNAYPYGSRYNIPAIYDSVDDNALCEADYGNQLAAPPAATSAPAFLLMVSPDMSSAVGVGATTFTLTYNKPMNTAVLPSVTFDSTSPYSAHIIEPNPGWIDSSTWRGMFAIQSDMGDGAQTLRVSGPIAADGFAVPDDTSNQFYIDLSGVGSANNGLASALGVDQMNCSWTEAGKPPTSLGYNLMRSEVSDKGPFVKANGALIATGSTVDTCLASGKMYFYKVYLVDAQNSAAQWTPVFFGQTTGGGGASVQFSSAFSSAAEGAGTIHIPIALSQTCVAPVTVNYSLSGTAMGGGADYQTPSGSVTIAAGQTNGAIDIMIVNETAVEPDETIIVTLTGATNASLGTQRDHTFTIINDDLPQVNFSQPNSSCVESAGTVQVALVLSQAIDKTVTVLYSVSGSATSSVDYAPLAGSVTFSPNQTAANISVPITDDAEVELIESIILTLSSAVNATLGPNNSHSLALQDNDLPIVRFQAASSTANESDGAIHITAQLSARTNQTVTVGYSTSGTATVGVDYAALSGLITFNPTMLSQTIDIALTDDALIEPDETIILTITSATNAMISAPSVHTVTIADNDMPAVNFSPQISEAREGVGTATIPLCLTAPAYKTVTVNYSIAGTATPGTDYATLSGHATFAALQTRCDISVAIMDEMVAEGDETVVLQITSAQNATIGAASMHILQIKDSDLPGPPSVASITRLDASPTSAASVRYLAHFSEPVTGVSAGDFSLNGSGLVGASIQNVSGSRSDWTVTVASGSGCGTLRMDALDDDTIVDGAGNPLGGIGSGNGAFTGGEAYSIDRVAPTLPSGIILADATPTSANIVRFVVNFSESVGATFTSEDVSVSTTLASGATAAIAGGPQDYIISVTATNADEDGTIGISIGTAITDLVGNAFAGADISAVYAIENTAPTALLASAESDPTSKTIAVMVTLSESTEGFAPNDLTMENAIVENFTGSGISYSFDLIATTQGLCSVTIPSGAFTDAAGNPNAISNTLSRTYDSIPPEVFITVPTAEATFRTSFTPLPLLAGTAMDAGSSGAISLVWANAATGQSGMATGGANWSVADIALILGDNFIVATATDAAGNQSSASLLVAYALNEYTLTYVAGENGSITGATSQTVTQGASGTTVTAVPNMGFHFIQWSDGVLTAARADANVTTDISVTAIFAVNTYTLTLKSQNPNGGVELAISPLDNAGQGAGATQFTRTYDYKTTVTLTAPLVAPNGYLFYRWTMDGQPFAGATARAVQVLMNDNRTMTAIYYTNTPTLMVSSQNPDSGLGIAIYPADKMGRTHGMTQFACPYVRMSLVTLTAPAVAPNGWVFAKWLKDGADFANNTYRAALCSMDNDHAMTAVYAHPANVKLLTVASSNPSSGVAVMVFPALQAGRTSVTTQYICAYAPYSLVTLTAPPVAPNGYVFSKWLKDGFDFPHNTQRAALCSMGGDHAMTAVYVHPQNTALLTVASSNPDGGVQISLYPADGNSHTSGMTRFVSPYAPTSLVTLTAAPTAPNGNVFVKWLRDGADFSSNTRCAVLCPMSADHTMTAIYQH